MPTPKHSRTRLSSASLETSDIVMTRSWVWILTSEGTPGSVILPAAWAWASSSVEARVMPGKMVPSRFGVIKSMSGQAKSRNA